MRKTVLFALVLLILGGCGIVRKIDRYNSSENNINTGAHRDSSTTIVIDTTKTDDKVISIVEVEFYDDTVVVKDTTAWANNTVKTKGTTISGKIKKAKITEIEIGEEKKGKSEQSTVTSETKKQSISENVQSSVSVVPQKDPRRFVWLAILISVCFVVLLFLYYKFIKPLGIGSFFGKITAILKK